VIVGVAALALMATSASAQLAVQQPTVRIAVLPLAAGGAADSATSIKTMDAARLRLESLAKYKALIVPKNKLCEVLTQSGFVCDDLLDADESRQLARHLNLSAYTLGRLERKNGQLSAYVRMIDISSSGLARAFQVEDAAAEALGEKIAQRLNQVIRAGEHAKECNDNRNKGQLQRAVSAANKALQADPDLTGAHVCLIYTYEALKMPTDSIIAVANRALRGDPQNSTALTSLAGAYLQKADTTRAMDARFRQWNADRSNKAILMSLIQMQRVRKQIPAAVALVDSGLTQFPGDAQLGDLRASLCIEGQLSCALDALIDLARRDSTKLKDTTFAKAVIANATQLKRPEECRRFAAIATNLAPTSTSFWKVRGGCFELVSDSGQVAGNGSAPMASKVMLDSALWAYRKASDLDPADVSGALLVAKAMVDGAGLDSQAVRTCTGDTACVNRVRGRLSDRLDTAKVYIDRGLVSSDSALRFSATVIAMTAGQKLAQAQAYARSIPWFERILPTVQPRTTADTVGPRAAVRTNSSFWWGLASTITLAQPFQAAVETKKCDEVKPIVDRMERTKAALTTGRRIHPPTADQMLGILKRYEANIPRIRTAYKCKNF
jgi:tetratricopeptide (TPR) repeat protein